MGEQPVSIKKIEYGQVGQCLQVDNGTVDFVATLDCGPRIIRFGFSGQHNEFCEQDGAVSTYGGQYWQPRGGHRLWHSPEHMPRTYIADNSPVDCQLLEDGVILTQPVEPWVQIQKEMEVRLTGTKQVTVINRLTNKNAWPVKLAVWGLTVMAPGGLEIVPQPDRDTGLLGNRMIALWPYTKMTDQRVHWGDGYITLQQDAAAAGPFKFGIDNQAGWAAYVNRGHVFIKRYAHQLGAEYPDFGVSYETYTNELMLEMETLSPLTLLKPDETIEHREIWELFVTDETPQDEAGISKLIKAISSYP